ARPAGRLTAEHQAPLLLADLDVVQDRAVLLLIDHGADGCLAALAGADLDRLPRQRHDALHDLVVDVGVDDSARAGRALLAGEADRKSTRLNSSHVKTSYA